MRSRSRVLFQFEIDLELRRKLRHLALDCDLPAAALVRRAIRDFLERRPALPLGAAVRVPPATAVREHVHGRRRPREDDAGSQ